jgi:hypothetical protein
MPIPYSDRLGLTVAIAAMTADASVTVAQPEGEDLQPAAPIRCYVAATNNDLSTNRAVNLCAGAVSDAPAACVAAAQDRILTISDADVVRLCARATSTEPATCAARLDDTTTLSLRRIVSYCAASQWPYVPARSPGAPACVENALERTTLSDGQAVRLCQGARTTAPVACFERGDERTTLSSQRLITLCRVLVPAAVTGRP